ncbi:hypothetical protein [Streptomyces buecherae]|uniref:Uncharacterized protein n=1 Tax=Streptomyces buecherae TaxID=2763006 RepID=A0A7H8NGI2_9ACTN|nr:hypothetical protein [Streptomyces buecherae]QKW53613.1 hypothetical protein HUT08_33280 [Streptomyces buecherae]
MPSPDHDAVPDIALGHHPDHGIVAANPKRLAAGAWLLEGFGFRPVPGEPTLYALTTQQNDGSSRATQTVALLRKAGYQVHTDAAFEPALVTVTAPVKDRPLLMEPDIAFAEHPQLGIVAAIDDRPSALGGGPILEEHGWRHSPPLDIYLLALFTFSSSVCRPVWEAVGDLSLRRCGREMTALRTFGGMIGERPRICEARRPCDGDQRAASGEDGQA